MISTNIKNIIFDLGGVILNIDYNITIDRFKNFGIENFDKTFNQARQTTVFDDYETGQISEPEFVAELQKQFRIQKELIIEAWNSMLLGFPKGRKNTMEQYAQNYNIVLLSNTNETHVKAFKKIMMDTYNEYWFPEVFQNVYYSNEIGMRKPNAEVFDFVLTENNFKPENTLFIDDTLQHIEGAAKLGIQTLHLTDKTIEDFL